MTSVVIQWHLNWSSKLSFQYVRYSQFFWNTSDYIMNNIANRNVTYARNVFPQTHQTVMSLSDSYSTCEDQFRNAEHLQSSYDQALPWHHNATTNHMNKRNITFALRQIRNKITTQFVFVSSYIFFFRQKSHRQNTCHILTAILQSTHSYPSFNIVHITHKRTIHISIDVSTHFGDTSIHN